MKAWQFAAPYELRRIEIEEPSRPAPGEALVRVARVGVCGTDISGFLGKMPLFSYPRIPGHELGVEVVEVGADVAGIAVGDRCSVEPYINDPASYASRRGRPNCCEKLQVLGVHIDGGLRPFFRLPARKLHGSGQLSFEQLALVETLAIGCHAVARSGLVGDETCMIIGAGPIGLATLEFARLTGARIIMLDKSDQRRDFCRRVQHVSHVLEPSERLESDLRELCDGHLPDVIFDATGSSASMSSATAQLAPGGRLVLVGITSDEISFRHAPLHKAEGTILASRNALPEDFDRIIGLIEAGRIDTGPWITHRVAFDDLDGVFPSFARVETGVIKAIIEL